MASKIVSVTIICPGLEINQYIVGQTYNGLLLDHISDRSIEYEDSLTILYVGYTRTNETVFEAIDAPMVVDYCHDETKGL